MSRHPSAVCLALCAAAMLAGAGSALPAGAAVCSAIDANTLGAPAEFRYGLSSTELQREFFDSTGWSGQGYRPRRLTGYLDGSAPRFATRWVRDGGPVWSSRFGLRGDSYTGPEKRFAAYGSEMQALGYRPTDVSGYNTASGDVRYAAIWERNTAGVSWRLHRDVTRAGMQTLVDMYGATGWVPVRVEGYALGGALRYISIWVQDGCDWRMHNRMTRDEYQAKVDEYASAYRLVHVDSFREGGEVSYAGIWWRQAGPAQIVRTNRDWYLFQRFFNNLSCAGYVLENVVAGETPTGGVHYGGVWTFSATPDVDADAPLRDRVRKHVHCAPGRAGAAVVNVTTGESILLHADQPFGTSSTIKSAILYALLRRIDADPNLTLDSTLDSRDPYGSNPDVGNAMPVSAATCATSSTDVLLQEDTRYTLRCLAQLMIRVSHNWATNRLIDLVGRATINAELAALGLSRTRLERYMTGDGAPSPHGNSGPRGDYEDGWDNVSTPRDLTTFLRRVHDDGALPVGSPLKRLTPASWSFFWASLGRDGNGGVNTKGYFSALLGNIPDWTDAVEVRNKPGSNTWSGDSFTHRPQIGAHLQASEAGRLVFADGQVVFYAMFVDEADTPEPSPDHRNAIQCTGLAVVSTYSGVEPSAIPMVCR
jgi:hypothetical protein